MVAQNANQIVFDFLPQADVVVQQHEGQITSDGGLLAIREFDHRWQYSRRMAACLTDRRADPAHSVCQMLRQRLYGILGGYEDCNDHDELRDEPVFKMVAGKLPEDDPLASQPTLSRFENAIKIPVLQNLMDFLMQTGIERLKEKHGGRLPAELTLDLDATDDPATPCGKSGPTSRFTCGATPPSACRGCTRSARKTTSPIPWASPPTRGSRTLQKT